MNVLVIRQVKAVMLIKRDTIVGFTHSCIVLLEFLRQYVRHRNT